MSKYMLMKVRDNGEHLLMGDGSIWMPSPGDMPTVCTWSPTATIKIDETNVEDMFPYTLTNEGIRVSVRARRLK